MKDIATTARATEKPTAEDCMYSPLAAFSSAEPAAVELPIEGDPGVGVPEVEPLDVPA